MKNIFITGGTGNLGKQVVDALSAENIYALHLAVRDEATDAPHNIFHHNSNLLDEDATAALIENISNEANTEAAVFIAGGYMYGPADAAAINDVHKMVDLNFATAFHPSKHLIKHFKKNGKGKLIFIGAKAATIPGIASQSMAYALSKQMILHYADMINETEKQNGITAHVLLPGTLDTALNRKQMPDDDFSQWTSLSSVSAAVLSILKGTETSSVILL